MRRILLGVLLGLALAAPGAGAFRTEQPPTFSAWTTNTFAQLNATLLSLWNVTNGRYQVDVVTVDPDGSRKGTTGEAVLFDTGTDQWCVNVDSETAWKCVNLS